ncbi:MAG TPA: hypothetical protein VGL07_13175 [Buttiauxella sp.]
MASSRAKLPPTHLIDDLLQGTVLFVIDEHDNRELKRDATFYCRGCGLVEALKAKLERLNMSDEFTEHKPTRPRHVLITI